MEKCNLKKIMHEKNITIKQLSKMSGLKEQTIKLYYYDKVKKIKFETLNKLCAALACDVNDLIITHRTDSLKR